MTFFNVLSYLNLENSTLLLAMSHDSIVSNIAMMRIRSLLGSRQVRYLEVPYFMLCYVLFVRDIIMTSARGRSDDMNANVELTFSPILDSRSCHNT